jgi:hypothetical protein
MGIDRPDDDDRPLAVRACADTSRLAPADGRSGLPDAVGPPDGVLDAIRVHETRDRATYYAELRAAVAAERGEATAPAMDAAPAGSSDLPAERRVASAPADTSARRGALGQELDARANADVDRGCDRIREAERGIITPAMREIEAEDPGRNLVGLDHRIKGEDRLKEKVAALLDSQPDMTAGQALASIADSIRFTFCYAEERYAAGVRADADRLHSRGFEMIKLKNTWDSDQYKGINSQWQEPETGQRFEVQFHTPASFEAKQHTHAAYERIRDPAISDVELDELKQAQRQVCATITVPPGADQIGD